MTLIVLVAVRNKSVRLFSYIVARDYGFAPNPFYGICTLATCKPGIRKSANIGDWIIGTGSKQKGRGGRLVYVMCVTETMKFNEYWEIEQFQRKKPNLRGSSKQAFGDNIYLKNKTGQWQQQDSHHSYPNGVINMHNVRKDTKTDRVLLSSQFAYWGGSGPEIPQRFRNCNQSDICCAFQNYKCKFPEKLVNEFLAWIDSLQADGFLGEPLDWLDSP